MLSTAFPFLMDLEPDEVPRFFAGLSEALDEGSYEEVCAAVDRLVHTWTAKARESRTRVDLEALGLLRAEVDALRGRAAEDAAARARADLLVGALKAKLEDAADRMDRVRALGRRAAERCVDVSAGELGQVIGGLWVEGA